MASVSALPLPKKSELSDERKDTLLAYWRDVLTGKVQPDVLVIPPEVEERVRHLFPE
jgi:hypothetical protein